MTAEIVKLELAEIGSQIRFDADEVLKGAMGQPFTTIAILAQDEDGKIWVSGNANAGETLVLMERAKHQIVFGDDE